MSDIKKGALHRQLHLPQDKPIPTPKLRQIANANEGTHIQSGGHSVPVTLKLKKRANFALSFR